MTATARSNVGQSRVSSRRRLAGVSGGAGPTPTRTATVDHLESAARAFAEATAAPPFLAELGPAPGRAALAALQAGPVATLPVDIEETAVEGGPTGPVAVRLLRPQRAPATLPVLVYTHGAGWAVGDAPTHTHDRLVRELAVGAGVAVVFPEYRLSPEVRYPSALEESWTVARWIIAEGPHHGLDAERIAVAGDSVGGNGDHCVAGIERQAGDQRSPSECFLRGFPAANTRTIRCGDLPSRRGPRAGG
jgi:acetyl esterase